METEGELDIVPKTDKDLEACTECKLIMEVKLWEQRDYECPNCSNTASTPHFKGLTSVIYPSESWVSKYSQRKGRIPGVYAIHVFS